MRSLVHNLCMISLDLVYVRVFQRVFGVQCHMQGKFRPGKLEVRNEEPAVLEAEFAPLMSSTLKVGVPNYSLVCDESTALLSHDTCIESTCTLNLLCGSNLIPPFYS